MGYYDKKACPCGSGMDRDPQFDARGIFLCFTCDKCEAEKLAHYRKEVLTDSDYDHPDCPIEPDGPMDYDDSGEDDCRERYWKDIEDAAKERRMNEVPEEVDNAMEGSFGESDPIPDQPPF